MNHIYNYVLLFKKKPKQTKNPVKLKYFSLLIYELTLILHVPLIKFSLERALRRGKVYGFYSGWMSMGFAFKCKASRRSGVSVLGQDILAVLIPVVVTVHDLYPLARAAPPPEQSQPKCVPSQHCEPPGTRAALTQELLL